MSDETEKSFKVTDRRIHADSEEEQEETAAPEEDATPTDEQPQVSEPDADAADAGEGAASDEPQQDDQAAQEFPLSFATFVISLGDSALIHLGAIPHPATGKPQPDMQAARQTIDILGIIEEKTQGNLSEEEQKLMTNLLYTLRMQWIQVTQA